jgi:hypothetical protein
MSTISQRIATKHTAIEMKAYVQEKILQRSELMMILQHHEWNGNTLIARSALGSGTVEFVDYEIRVEIELTVFGSAAKGRIEKTLNDQFKLLK